MTPHKPYSELTHLWSLWYCLWLKHLHNPRCYAICWRHMAELEELGA